MEKFKVSFVANNQQLTATGTKHASDTYADIEATFVLGEKWTDMDSVSAVWWNDFTRVATVLDSQGKCIVPHEVLERKGYVRVNLVGSVVENGELVTRLTSYSAEAVKVNEKIKLTGNEPQSITPSQYEQFVQNVKADADRAEAGATSAETSAGESEASATASAQSATASANSASQAQTYAQNAQNYAVSAETAKDDAIDAKEDAESAKADAESARDQILGMRATANTLAEGSDATASYSDGVLTLGIPRGNTGAKGDKGDKGDTGATPNLSIGTVETLPPTGSSEVTITGTAENPVLNFKLVKGDTGEVTMAQLAQLLPTDTASGEIASFPDGTDIFPAVSVLTTIEPIQSGSGTPSPDNVRPISGHTECVTSVTGVNVWDEEWEVGTINANTGENFSASDRIRSKNLIRVIPTQTYYINGARIQIYKYDADGSYIGHDDSFVGANATFTIDEGVHYIRFITTATYGTTYNHDICINYPSTDHDYHAYDGTTYTTTLGRTVYGGTLDVVSGELVVDRAMVTLDGSESWLKSSSYNGNYYLPVGGIMERDEYPKNATQNIVTSNGLKPVETATELGNNDLCILIDGGDYPNINIKNTSKGTLEDFKAWLADNPLQVCYELATPQTIQLTPQEVTLLLGQNNIWADSGAVEVVYKADVGLYIDKKLN